MASKQQQQRRRAMLCFRLVPRAGAEQGSERDETESAKFGRMN